ESGKDAARFLQEHLARDRQRHPASGSIQQLGADLLLEQRDLMRDSWLRKIAEAGCSRKVPQFGDRHECAQLTQFHSYSLSEEFDHFIGRMRWRPLQWLQHDRDSGSK